jgi:hypothetical protein
MVGLLLPVNDEAETLREGITWRLAIGLPAILAIVQSILLIFVFTYDSPNFYSDKGDEINVYKIFNELAPQITREDIRK